MSGNVETAGDGARRTWRIAEPVAWQLVGGEAILVDLKAGRAMGLNAAGSFIWPLIESETEAGIVRAVAAEFGVDTETARDAVAGFLGLLLDRGLLEVAGISEATSEPVLGGSTEFGGGER